MDATGLLVKNGVWLEPERFISMIDNEARSLFPLEVHVGDTVVHEGVTTPRVSMILGCSDNGVDVFQLTSGKTITYDRISYVDVLARVVLYGVASIITTGSGEFLFALQIPRESE